MLTVEIALQENGEAKEIVELYFDDEGLEELLARLLLLRGGPSDHLHLMSESWGLGDLSEKKNGTNTMLAHHLKLTLLK